MKINSAKRLPAGDDLSEIVKWEGDKIGLQ